MQQMKKIVGLGEALWDVLPEGKQIGGAPINFAYHAMQFGHEAYAVSAVGKDDLGKELCECLEAKGIRLAMPAIDFPTGTVDVCLSEGGVPVYSINLGAAWDNIPYLPEMKSIARSADAVCFGTLAQRSETSRNTIYGFLDDMPDGENKFKVFDINLRQDFYSAENIAQSLQRSNVLKLNDEELPIAAALFDVPANDYEKACTRLAERFGLRYVILTCGTHGSYVFANGRKSFIETPIVEVVDTVGAGDSFSGAFVGSLLNGETMSDAHVKAVRTSAYVCKCHGAMPDMRHLRLA